MKQIVKTGTPLTGDEIREFSIDMDLRGIPVRYLRYTEGQEIECDYVIKLYDKWIGLRNYNETGVRFTAFIVADSPEIKQTLISVF